MASLTSSKDCGRIGDSIDTGWNEKVYVIVKKVHHELSGSDGDIWVVGLTKRKWHAKQIAKETGGEIITASWSQ